MIATEHVTGVLSDRLGTGPGRWEQQVLGETPGLRRVVACAFHGAAALEPVRLVAKAYETSEGERTAQLMAALCAQLAVRPDVIAAVPQPIFYDRDNRLLVQQVASGRPYPELAASDRVHAHLAAAGAAVATLHRLPVPAGPPRSLRDNLRDLVHPHPAELAERVPGLAARVAAIIAGLEELDRASGPAPVALTHRDLHLRQLLRDGARVWVLDWDLAAATDAALDLGNLIAYMATKLPADRAMTCSDALLEGYAADTGAPAVARRRLYEAFTYVRLACKRFRLGGDDWLVRAEDMLARAERRLEA
jgi:aminoglycoside phosphotransferase (APT) family kinase protein